MIVVFRLLISIRLLQLSNIDFSSGKLLFGPGCLSNIGLLKSSYDAKIIEIATQHVKTDIINFHPIMGLKNKIRLIPLNKFNELQNLNLTNISEPKAYKFRSYLFDLLALNEQNYNNSSIHMNTKRNFSLLNEVTTGIDLLRKTTKWMGDLIDITVNDIWVTNNKQKDRFTGGASTSYELQGLIFMSLRENSTYREIDQVFALAHELGHTILYLLQAGSLPIFRSSWSKWVYSGLRKTDRPSYASLHAAVALGYMLESCRGLIKSGLYKNKYIEYLSSHEHEFVQALSLGLDALEDLNLTNLGKIIYNELRLL